MLQRDNGLVNHVLRRPAAPDRRPAVLADRRQQFRRRCWSSRCGVPGRSRCSCLTAGLQTIPDELYEAAAIDGAGFWPQVRTITLPMLRPVNQVLILVLVLWTFNDFNTPYVLFGGVGAAGGRPDLGAHLPELVHHLELRLGSAM